MSETINLYTPEFDAELEKERFESIVAEIDAVPFEVKERAAKEATMGKMGGPADDGGGFDKADDDYTDLGIHW